MTGVLRTRDVLLHLGTVLRYYGPRVAFRCAWSGLVHDKKTFLEIIYAQGHKEKDP